DQHLARLTGGSAGERVLLTLAARFPSRPTVDFKVGRLAFGFDEALKRFVLVADEEEAEEQATHFTCQVAEAQVRALTVKISEIVAAGRPRCPLCGAPMEGTHVCPLANGRVH